MRSRSFIAVTAALVGLCALAGAVLAYDNAQRNTIAKGFYDQTSVGTPVYIA